VWTIKQFSGTKEFLMRAHFGLPSVQNEDGGENWKKPIEVKFEIPYFTVSGLQVAIVVYYTILYYPGLYGACDDYLSIHY
jgi:hypothetical protein